MVAQPLLDFDALDLSRVVVPIEEIRKACRQRGKLELLDGLLHFDLEGRLAVGFKDLKHDDWWTSDHVPGRPIFPGVLMIEGAAQVCTFDFLQRRGNLEGGFIGYGGINRTRFRGVVEPGCRILWAARAERLRRDTFTYAVQAFVERRLVLESEILGVVI